MKNQHFKLLEHAARLLRPLGRRVVFVGGASVSLHLDDPAVVPRHTKDVDVVVEVTSYSAHAELEQSLRRHKFSQSLTDDDSVVQVGLRMCFPV